MSSQYDLPLSDACHHHSTRSGILTPASDHSLNMSDAPCLPSSSGAKKRKRDGSTMEDLLRDTFVVKPYPTTVYVKPRTLQPLMLLPRSCLPLAYLDFTPSASALPQSRLFETHVKLLELEERMGNEPMVLIARLDDGRTLYAVEREDRGLYVLCRLGSWINLHQLRTASVASWQEVPRGPEKGFGIGLVPTQHNAAPITTSETRKYDKEKRLAIEALQSMVKRPSTAMSSDFQPANEGSQPLEAQNTESQLLNAPVDVPVVEKPHVQLTSTEILDNVRTQYLEALYLSKASLAYFAKGPLSRARAAFHLDYDSNLEMSDLVTFLEGLVLSTTQVDKKYRDGVPTCVSMIDIEDSANENPKAKKRKSSKNIKPGKNGLYPSEENLIRQWWASHDDDADTGGPANSRDEITKSRISQLRIRETQLQLIIILEVLALQPLVVKPEEDDGLPSTLPQSETPQAKEKSSKKRKSDFLSVLLDVHIDRLCIWQSIQLEIGGAAPSRDSQTHETVGATDGPRHTDNILRDFCVEIIAPFFSARLPERCAIINRKLGGPVAMSPPKPRVSKSASFSGAPARPGAATKRPVPVKPRKSLQRILTDERERRSISRGPERGISLLRSASIPGFKRENSEAPSLSGIPFADSQGIIKSKQLARREVDLGSLVSSKTTKESKQAKIDAELKDAISALKKPNRELTAKSMVETAERRSTSSVHPRKSKKPVRNPLFQGVQISATPKTNRSRDVFSKRQQQQSHQKTREKELDTVPASSALRIPQSSVLKASPRNPRFSSIQATPTRKSLSRPSSMMDLGRDREPVLPPLSPCHIRRSSAQLFAAIPDSAVKAAPASWAAHGGVQETPVKNRSVSTNFDHGHPASSPKFDQENSRKVGVEEIIQMVESSTMKTLQQQSDSIYKSLGWDDDDIDDLV
ncbi:hypothetical protein HYALB_00012448 [Hymenoscyphus albidus]|uniref:DNA replication regulator Sld3 C-terminal domain-containing protein n=1 Tax=Hymenoscyphus albidus TaxID=595503 RepID=A0A9N9LQE6_9HELO|nr:hypothetical protein HYALB_00012448 [Hymenoscyphus albidus]